MARAVFFNLPYYGHVNPTLSLIAELTRRGERITYYSSETFRPAIERAGATFHSIDAFITERTPVDENLVRFASALMGVTNAILPTLLDDLRDSRPDYILHDSLCIWGRCVAESLHIPAIASIATLARPHSPWHREVVAGTIALLPSAIPMVAAARRELRAFTVISRQLHQRYGCARLGLGDAYNNLAELNIVYSIPDLQSWPHSFDRRFRFVGPLLDHRDMAPAFPFESLGDQPLIYISLGTLFNAKTAFYRRCVAAFAVTPYQVVMAIGHGTDPQSLGEIPSNFIVRPSVPQLEILRRAALFITHGGMNSVTEGLAADVPLLVVPQGADQFFVARRIERLGAGIMVKTPTATDLRHVSTQLLTTSSYRHRSAQLGAALRTAGGVVVAADAIEAYMHRFGL